MITFKEWFGDFDLFPEDGGALNYQETMIGNRAINTQDIEYAASSAFEAVSNEYKKQIEYLESELAKERECVDYYANKDNWAHSYRGQNLMLAKKEDHEPYDEYEDLPTVQGGKLARQRQSERKEIA